MEAVFNARAFLRWAGVNLLIGQLGQLLRHPVELLPVQLRARRRRARLHGLPYFTFIPWDYDNSFGIDYFGTAWQYTDLLDWPANTRATAGPGRVPDPAGANLLANRDFRAVLPGPPGVPAGHRRSPRRRSPR